MNTSDKDKLKESSLDCHESMEVYKQGTKERDLHDDDLYWGIEEGETEHTQISARELNESDDEYVPPGEKRFRKSFNQKELTDFIRDTGVSKDIGFTSSVLIRRGLAEPGTKSSIYRERAGKRVKEIFYFRWK